VLKKQPGRAPGSVDVTFIHPVNGADVVTLVGDFNGWADSANPMTIEDGHASCTVALPVGEVHRFRYLIDGTAWANDWAADSYLPNDFGGDDSVVDLRTPDPAPASRRFSVDPAGPVPAGSTENGAGVLRRGRSGRGA